MNGVNITKASITLVISKKNFLKEINSNAMNVYVFLFQNTKDVPCRGKSNPESRDQQVTKISHLIRY